MVIDHSIVYLLIAKVLSVWACANSYFMLIYKVWNTLHRRIWCR